MFSCKKAFSLVELSIVLIVIGLLVTGVSNGSKLIENAKINQTISQLTQIKSAYNTYRVSYDYIPGDHNNATSFWGGAGSCFADTTGTTSTCNGDGNGLLRYLGSTTGVAYEPWHFWKHLANSEILPGDFSGYSDNTKCATDNLCMETGKNTPEGPFRGTGWYVFSASYTSFSGRPNNRERNILVLSNPSNWSGHWNGVSITPSQQYRIDNKLDDGMPYQGKVVDMSGNFYSPNCATINSDEFGSEVPGTTSIGATYELTYTDVACIMFVDLE